MNTSQSDEDSEDYQNEEEDLVGNVAFAGYLSTNVCSHMQKKTNHVATEIIHCYNNIVAVDDVANSKKKCDNLIEADSKSNDGSDFDGDALQEAYQCTYSQWLKIRKKNQYLVSHVDALVIS